MGFKLGPKAVSGDYRVASFETIGSTSTEALDRARTGDHGRLWVTAKQQTAGHGRRGRVWETPGGNLAASLLVGGTVPPDESARLGFVAGLALVDAVRAIAPAARLQLKWPNDVLLDGAKLAGILLEAFSLGSSGSRVVIGIGVNVRHAPRDLPYQATSLAAHNVDITAEELFEALSDAWVDQELAWDTGRGFSDIRDRWLDAAAGLGSPIAVRMGEQVHRGTFETIDEEGRLVVRGANGLAKTITAGEVHFGLAATAGI